MVWSEELVREDALRLLLCAKILGRCKGVAVEVGHNVQLASAELRNTGVWIAADHVLDAVKLGGLTAVWVLPLVVADHHGLNAFSSACELEWAGGWDVWQVLRAEARAEHHVSCRVTGVNVVLLEVVLWHDANAAVHARVELGVVQLDRQIIHALNFRNFCSAGGGERVPLCHHPAVGVLGVFAGDWLAV